MQKSPTQVVSYVPRSYDDPEYDALLQQFIRAHPDEYKTWRQIELDLFQSKKGLVAYPDQQLRTFCLEFLSSELVDFGDGFGPSRAWSALRGRILRSLVDESSTLNPAPGMILLTEPRTMTDAELQTLVEIFKNENPAIWDEWEVVENGGRPDADDPLREASLAFHLFARSHCLVQTNTAVIGTFLEVRKLHWAARRRALAWN
jgi:hypothetical protein